MNEAIQKSDVVDDGAFYHFTVAARANPYFRHVVLTDKWLQVALMTLLPGETTGAERHETATQSFRVVSGTATFVVSPTNSNEATAAAHQITEREKFTVPQNTRHNLINQQHVPLVLWTAYSKPMHTHGVIHRRQADAAREEFEREEPIGRSPLY